MKKSHFKNLTSENGSILFIVILGIITISALVIFTRDRLSGEIKFVDWEYRKLKSYLNCHSGLQYALNRYLTGRHTANVLIDDLNVEFKTKFLLDGTKVQFKGSGLVSEDYLNNLSVEIKDLLKNLELEISFLDSAGLIGFQQLPEELIKNFLSFNGMDMADCDLIIDSIKDWIDIDDLTRLHGAERGYYEDVMLPANRNISSVEELCLIRGVGREVFDLIKKFVDFSLLKKGMNPNTMPPACFYVYPRITGQTIQQIVDARKERYFINIQDLTLRSGYNFSPYQQVLQFLPSPDVYLVIRTPFEDNLSYSILLQMSRMMRFKPITPKNSTGLSRPEYLHEERRIEDFYVVKRYEEGFNLGMGK